MFLKLKVIFLFRRVASLPKPYVPVNSKTAHPFRANPGAFDFFEKFWSNPPLYCQFRWSNAPPVSTSKRVKSPTLQACLSNCGNKFCKIFSHYEFLAQLSSFHTLNKGIFNDVTIWNDNNRKTRVESTRAMTRERGSSAESKNCESLLLPTADRRFDTKVKCPTGWASFWVKFPTVRSLTRVKCPGIAPRGDGWFCNWLVH